MVQASPGPGPHPDPGRLPAPRGALRAGPGGISKEITAGKAARILESIEPSGAVALARCELAAEFLGDLRRIDAQMRDTKKKLAVTVRASGTTLTEIFGVGPVIAATMIGYVADVSRFPSRDNFAAYNGTAPVEVSSGNRKIYRLSRRGNRRLNHAVHMAAVTQIRYRHSDGRAYYDRKLAEGKTPKEALRCLKRRVSDAIYARLQADARRAAAFGRTGGPGGQPGNHSVASAAAHTPKTSSSRATPEPATTLRRPDGHPPTRPAPAPKKTRKALDTKRLRYARLFGWLAGYQCRAGRIVLEHALALRVPAAPAGRRALPDWAPGLRISRWRAAHLVASGLRQKTTRLVRCPHLAEPVLGRIGTAVDLTTGEAGRAEPAAAARRRPVDPVRHWSQNPPPTTVRSAQPDVPSAGRGARRADRSSQ